MRSLKQVETFRSFRSDSEADPSTSNLKNIALQRIQASPYQTREDFNEQELEELAQSIQNRGLVQAIVVRPLKVEANGDLNYELVVGERRLRAARLCGLESIPCVVRELEDQEAAELQIIENAQRRDLNPIEQARAFQVLTMRFGMKQGELAQVLGKSRSVISNSLRLLQLPEEVIELLHSGDLSEGHARLLLMLEESTVQVRFARKIVRNDISVRALESLIRNYLEAEDIEEELSEEEARQQASIERARSKIQTMLGVERVGLNLDDEGNRRVQITFETEASWRRFMKKLRS